MKKLNIYCGIRSIGWNVTEDDEVIDFGVKRVNVDFDSYYAFTAGLPVAKRIDRRMKRQARRNLWRYKTRREKLGKLLKSDGRYPTSKQLQADRAWLNAMRSRACIEKVDSQALGRVLIDLQRKRGYKSMRGVDDAGDSEYLETIAAHEAALKNFPTVGDYLASLDSCKNVILRRETYEAEYYRICEVQEIDHERYYGAIFRQRPLQKGKIAFCKLATNRKVTHQSNPNCQLFRILRDVNNIEIYDSTNTVIDISPEHRKAFIEHLRSGKDLTKAGALKIMGIKKSAAYTWYSGKSITGNVWGKLIGEKEDHPIPNAFTFQLWQDLISATDDNLLISILKRKYGYSHEQSEKLAGYDIKGLGYSEYSVKAINKLLPILKQGIKLNDAILDVYGKVDFVTGVRLRNVVLEQVHASCAALAKAIKAKHDVGEMQMEIDSLLKMGNKARKARATAQRRQEKDNAELNRRIVETGGEPSEYNRKKLRLWDEMSGVCPYFSDKKIELNELFTDRYNLDHIVPKSKLFEFSENNLVLCPCEINTKKLRQTGRDFAGGSEEYIEFVNSQKISEQKKQLLLMREEDIPNDYISRSAGTDYNTRCFLSLYPNSRCIPNKLINMYSKSWYGNPYDENDVRNVLVKSFVMANMSEETIDYFNHIRDHTREQTSSGAYDLQAEIILPDLSDIPVYCPIIKYFRKTKFGYISRFALHKESVYGQRKRTYRDAKGKVKEEVFYKIRQPAGKLTPKMVKNISDAAIRQLVEERIGQHKEHSEAIRSLADNPVLFNGKPVKSVSVNVYGETFVPLHSTDSSGHTAKLAKGVRKIDFVHSSMNYSLHIAPNGKKQARTLLQAVNELNSGKFSNYGLHKGDRVIYNDSQYIICGITDSKVVLRNAYTLLAENTLTLNRAEEIAKVQKQHIPQV